MKDLTEMLINKDSLFQSEQRSFSFAPSSSLHLSSIKRSSTWKEMHDKPSKPYFLLVELMSIYRNVIALRP